MSERSLDPTAKKIQIAASMVILIFLAGNFIPGVSAANASLVEWTLPDGNSGPWGIGVGSNGKPWITENLTNRIGSLDPVTNILREWNIPTGGSSPKYIYVKPSGLSVQVYFTEYGADKVGYFDNGTGTFFEWTLPSNAKPVAIAVDSGGNIWFTESGRDSIGEITPTTNTLTEYKLPATPTPTGTVPCGAVSAQLCPWGLVLQEVSTISGTNTFLWFTELNNNVVGRLEAKSHALFLYNLRSVYSFNFAPMDIKLDAQGNAIFTGTTTAANRVSVIRNQTNTVADLIIPTAQAKPTSVVWDPLRDLAWFTEYAAGKVSSVDMSGAVFQLLQVIPCTIGGTNPGSPDCGTGSSFTQLSSAVSQTLKSSPDNTRTVTPSLVTTIASQNSNQFAEYPLPTTISGPNQIIVDGSDNLWFTENTSSGNRLGFMTIVTAFNFGLSVSATTVTVQQGNAANYTVQLSLLSGSSVPVSLSISPAPPTGVTYSFTPTSGNPTYTSILSLGTTSSTPAGTYPFTVTATGSGVTKTASINLIVTSLPPANPFNFTLQVSGGTPATITAGQTATMTLSVAQTGNAPAQNVQLFATGQPAGVTAGFNPATGLPPYTSVLTFSSTTTATPGTYTITITGTGGGVTRLVSVNLGIVAPQSDFDISVAPNSLGVPQASGATASVTIQSIGVFSDPVILATSNLPGGISVSFTPNPIAASAGGTASSTATFTVSRSASPGTYTFSVTGTAGSLTHSTSVTVHVTGCVIATATYGSEVAPEVQFLRDFRDYQILHTFAGSSFMYAFNSWYYSFSPSVAQYISANSGIKTTMKFVLYPAIGVLHVASISYSTLAFSPEMGALFAGLIAGSLTGLVYLALPVFGGLWLVRKRMSKHLGARIAITLGLLMLGLIAGFVAAELFALPSTMMLISSAIVLTSLAIGSVLPALILATRLRTR